MDEHSGTLRTETHFITVRAKRFGWTVGRSYWASESSACSLGENFN